MGTLYTGCNWVCGCRDCEGQESLGKVDLAPVHWSQVPKVPVLLSDKGREHADVFC